MPAQHSPPRRMPRLGFDSAVNRQSIWLERFYDLVLVASVTHLAQVLGAAANWRELLVVVGWLAGLWLAWFLVTVRLNRFPDGGGMTRVLVIVQLLGLTLGVASTVTQPWRTQRSGS